MAMFDFYTSTACAFVLNLPTPFFGFMNVLLSMRWRNGYVGVGSVLVTSLILAVFLLINMRQSGAHIYAQLTSRHDFLHAYTPRQSSRSHAAPAAAGSPETTASMWTRTTSQTTKATGRMRQRFHTVVSHAPGTTSQPRPVACY